MRVSCCGSLDAAPTGRYRIVREIGRGGMGVVFEAVQEPLGRRVALKVLPHHRLALERDRLRFQREAELAARLDEPGICTVYDSGVESGLPYIAMRFVEGQTLSDHIDSTRSRLAREELDPPCASTRRRASSR
jgi:serine/threonine protein kinase